MPLEKKSSQLISLVAWCFYDWASSSYSAIITTFIFATYFTESVAKNKIIGTEQWGDAIALSGLIIALISPALGAIADNEGRRKPWLMLFSLLCITATALLWFSKPDGAYVNITLFFIVLATIGSEVAFVFYNSMLSDIAPENYIGRLSGWAWGLGYAGGLCALIFALVVFINHPQWLGLNTKAAEQIRICGPFVAVWFVLFSWPLFVFTPDMSSNRVGIIKAVTLGLKTFIQTLKSLGDYKTILIFLIARMFYIDGLNTIFAFGGIYAAGTFNMKISEVILLGITLNISAGIGAAMFAWIDDYKGPKFTILVSLTIMLATGIGIIFVYSVVWFWILTSILCLCVGPVQAASRSMMVRLAPKEIVTEMFGLYAFSGKATAFIGPWLLGLVTVMFDSQRVGVGTIMIFLIIGGIILLFVKEPEK